MKKIMSKLNSRITPKAWNWLQCFAGATVAIIGGIEAFFLVFAWPVFTPRYQDMLVWGWIGWIPGGLIGYYVTVVLGRLFRRILTSTASAADRRYALISLLVIVVVAVFLLNHGNVNTKWREQVRMADGSILLLKRTAKGEKYRPYEQEMSLEVVTLPQNWQPPPVWRAEYIPILLDYQPQKNTWSVVATFFWCVGSSELRLPSPYVEYQSQNGTPWKAVSLEKRLIGTKANLLLRPNFEGESSPVTAEEADRRNQSAIEMKRVITTEWRRSVGC